MISVLVLSPEEMWVFSYLSGSTRIASPANKSHAKKMIMGNDYHPKDTESSLWKV